jgi:hypothetical protein
MMRLLREHHTAYVAAAMPRSTLILIGDLKNGESLKRKYRKVMSGKVETAWIKLVSRVNVYTLFQLP